MLLSDVHRLKLVHANMFTTQSNLTPQHLVASFSYE